MRRISIGISAIAHLAIAVVFTAGLPWKSADFEIPPPIVVEMVEIAKVTQTDKMTPAPAPKKEEPPKPAPPAPPPPAAKNTAAEPTPPSPKVEKTPDKKTAQAPADPAVLPDKKTPPKKEEQKQDQAKAEPQRDFASVLRNLADTEPAPPAPDKSKDLKLDEKQAPPPGQVAPLGERLTISETDALRRQLERCWNVPIGAREAENLAVEIALTINPDRTLRDARVVDQARYNADGFFRAAADSALRAVRNPLCSPFQLPPDKFETWKSVTVTFNPKDMF